MAKQMMKCPYCKEQVPKDESEQQGKRYYHPECLEVKLEEEEKEKERKAKNKNDWDELFEYICELHNLDAPTGMMFKQLKQFRDEYDYTNKGIYLTLKYFYEVLDNSVREGDGLGIVPYMYENAKKHFIEIRDVKQAVEDIEGELVEYTKVKTKVKQRTPHRKIIDVGEL